MGNVVIQVENLTKEYRLGTINHGTLYRDLQSWWSRLRGKEDPNSLVGHHTSPSAVSNSTSRFLALDDVSFSVQQGDIVGIIGRNGAGKSTLLKILSQVTSPTSGVVKLKGRVASLLEVGTGFHPELTGRENVFLNGAILGMNKSEIRAKFDEIVAFAEIEKFIDTPVKRYSSGMYVRLAFAVAAHLEPEILIIDEVLAVGDAQFQKKCLGKMQDVGKEGRTVLFVSHNMQAVRSLCQRGILLSKGTVACDAQVAETLAVYNEQLRQLDFGATSDVGNEKNRRGSGAVRFTRIVVEGDEGAETSIVPMGGTVRFRLSYKVFQPIDHLLVAVVLLCGKTREIVTSTKHIVTDSPRSPVYEDEIIVQFNDINLRPKEYPLYFWLGDKTGKPFDVVDDVVAPLVVITDKDEDVLGYSLSEVPGYFNVNSQVVS